MKCTIPEISWHNRDPVLSVDIQPKRDEKCDFYRLASGGTDSHVLIWYLKKDEETGTINLDVVADLTRHQRAVNCVRWSPSGEFLASSDDESFIMIWKQKSDTEVVNILDDTNESDKEIWITMKVLRGHIEDVYDLSWCPNSQYLISGSVDNTAMVWDVQKGKSTSILRDHKGFVQGVAWDPMNQYLATLGTDRIFRVFDNNTRKMISQNSKCKLPVPATSPFYDKTVRLYHDDTLQTFFRRLTFSPDGQIIVVPAGVTEIDGIEKPLNTTYIYTRYSLKQPSIVLPSPDQYTIAVRFCPLLFELRPYKEKNPPIIPLPYRMVFAVATKNCVYLYDTQQKNPFGLISNIHYTRLTDLTWSDDGRTLIVSSTDGFCSIIIFNKNEIGTEYKPTQKEVLIANPEPMEVSKVEPHEDEKPKLAPEKKLETTSSSIVILPPIISSNEKFESPEKQDHPVTPIAIRRHPRTTPTNSPGDKFLKANPIAIRRKPKEAPPTAVDEAAIDAWPIDETKPEVKIISPQQDPMEVESTADIRLVYEGDETESSTKAPVTPGTKENPAASDNKTPKTPRRVDFRTISTPKSKKKLL